MIRHTAQGLSETNDSGRRYLMDENDDKKWPIDVYA